MGWQDRDWANLDESALYGGGGRPPKPVVSPVLMWSGIVLVTALTGVYLLSRPSPSPSGVNAPVHLFGHAITFAGLPSVCTEIAYNTDKRGWVCNRIQSNATHLPVIEPVPYEGPCTDAVADQTVGRWVCQGDTPFAPGSLPSVLMYAPDSPPPVPVRGNA